MLTDEVQKHKGVMLQAAARPSYDAVNDVYHMVEIKTEVIWGGAAGSTIAPSS